METTNSSSDSETAPKVNLDNSEVAPRDTSNNSAVKKGYDKKYAPLYKAVRHGDLQDVMKFLEAHPEGVNAIISKIGETALHLAVTFEHLHIVKELVNKMQEGDLEWRNKFWETALVTAAYTGIIEMAKCMIEKNRNLLMIPTKSGTLPVTEAVISNHKEMARYLYSVTPLEELKPENGRHGADLLQDCFLSDALDFTLDLVQRCPRLAITLNETNNTLLWNLATKPSTFPSGCQLLFWERWIYNWIQIEPATATKDIRINMEKSNSMESNDMTSIVPNKCHGLLHGLIVYIFNLIGIKRIHKLKLTHVMSLELLRITCNEIATLDDLSQLSNAGEFQSLFEAAENGIPEFIIELLNVNPSRRVNKNKLGRNFFFHAIQYRQAKVFNLIYGVTSSIRNDLASVNDKSENTALHMAALLAPSAQLHRIPGAALQMQRELQWFKEVEHVMSPSKYENLNNDDKNARQLFIEQHMDLRKDGENWMKQNATSYTIVAALIVTIMFAVSFTVPGGNNQNTGILTSRYAEDDFLKSLPNKLIIGLSMMFISIATMMITFSTAVSIMFPGKLWINILVIVFACVPISSFVWLQFPLLIEVYLSTYGPGIFERNRKRWF